MSFIFDALKKSEEQRQQGSIPDLRMAYQPLPPASARWRSGLILLLAVLVLNAVVLLWWLRPWQALVRAAPAAAPVQREAAGGEEPALARKAPVPETESGAKAGEQKEAAIRLAPAAAPAGWMEYHVPPPATSGNVATRDAAAAQPARKARGRSIGGIPHLEELSPSIRQALPEITISLHYYTADPTARLARLNGKILREGEETDNGLVLDEIIPSGVILHRGEVRFRVGDF